MSLGTESLNSDLESLERMVVEFAKDHGDSLSAAEIGSVKIIIPYESVSQYLYTRCGISRSVCFFQSHCFFQKSSFIF